MKTFVGCSGWQYDHWKKRFYPEGLAKSKWLKHYSETFNSVEVNATFYGSIKEKTFSKWHDEVPSGFKFTLKGSKWVTHIKKLHDVRKSLERFYKPTKALKQKLGCCLWQLPPSLEKDVKKLKKFCNDLDSRKNNVIEFRHKSWFCKEIYEILDENNVAFCVVSAPNLPDIVKKTSNILYLRFHGKKHWYKDSYSEKELERWEGLIKKTRAKYAYCYFNNDLLARAPKNAKMLGEMLK